MKLLFKKFIIFSVLVYLIGSYTGFSQTLDLKTYNIENGLTQSQVVSIVQDPDGFLWISTYDGISKFDGSNFENFYQKDGLGSNQVSVALQCKNGDLMFGHMNGKITIYKYKSKQFKIFPDSSISGKRMTKRISALIEDEKGRIWIGTLGEGVFMLEGDSLIQIGLPTNFSSLQVTDICEISKDEFWVGTTAGVFKISEVMPDKYSLLPIKELKNFYVTEIESQSDRNIWIGTRDNGLIQLQKQNQGHRNFQIRKYNTQNGLSDNWITTLLVDKTGRLWIGTRDGGVNILSIKDQVPHFQVINDKNGLPSLSVLSLFEDREGNIWIGTNTGGLTRYRENTFQLYTTRDGLVNKVVWSILQDKQGNYWFGTERGLSRFIPDAKGGTGGRFENYREILNMPIRFVYKLFQDSHGSIWGISFGRGVFKYSPESDRFTIYTTRNGLPTGSIFSIAEDSHGIIWFATAYQGVFKFNPQTGRFFSATKFDELKSSLVQVLFTDSHGNLWIGTENNGVLKYTGDRLIKYSRKTGYAIPSAISITEDKKGNYWFITYDGRLYKFDGKKFISYSDLDALSNLTFYSILVDKNSGFWLGSKQGVVYFNPQDSTYFRLDQDRDYPILEMNQNAILQDSKGDLWFGTIKGILKINPQYLRFKLPPSPVYISGIKLFLRNQVIPGENKFPYKQNYFTFYFQGICLAAPHSLRYQFKLEGFDQKWSPLSKVNFATYSNLPPGEYTFQVKAYNADGVSSEKAAIYQFEILAPFWQKWWFISLMIFVIGVATYSAYKRRVWKIERDKILLETKVKERTRALEEEKDKLRMAYEALRESEEKFRALAETATASILIYQGEHFVYVNPATEKITGYTRAELLQMKFWEVVHPSFREIVKKRGQARQFGNSVPSRYEFKIITKSGEEKWIDYSATPINFVGKPAAIGVAMEITERKIMEENLRKLYRAVETTPMGMVLLNRHGTIEYVNPGFLNICELESSENIIGKNILDITDTPGRKIFEREILPQLEQGKDWQGEVFFMKHDGQKFPAELICSVVKNEEGEPVHFLIHFQNIEARKKSEQILRDSEASYRELFNSIPEAIYVQDRDGKFLDVNDGAVRMYGYSKEEMIGQTPAMLAADGKVDLEETFGYLQKAFAGESQSFEWWGKRKNGEEFPKEVIITRSHYFGQEVAIAIARDITERKKAEEALTRLAYIADSITDFVLTTDKHGKISYVNQAALEKFGYKKEEIIGKDAFIFVSKSVSKEMIDEIFSQTRAGGWKGDLLVATKTGEEFWVSLKTAILKYDNQVIGMVAVSRDITERKKAEEALAAEKERLAVTLRSIADGVIATDTTGKIILMNPVAEKLTGIAQKEAEGKPLKEVLHIFKENTNGKLLNPAETVLRESNIIDFNDCILRNVKNATERIITLSGAPIKDMQSRNTGVVLVFQDITEKRKMEQEILKAQKIESVGLLAGGIAHDFNNILTGILGNISLAKMYARTDEKILRRLDEAEKATVRAKDLTQQLLTFSKGGAPVKEAAAIENIIRESIDFTVHGSSVQCTFDFPEDLWAAEVDVGQISQVLQNLIINAIQAMPEGGTIRVKAQNVFLEGKEGLPLKKGHYIKISIQDQGVGIPPQYLDKIFDPYFTTKQAGNGLGLTSAYSIIKKHDGYIGVQSELGKGSTFYIYLPAIPQKLKNTVSQEEQIFTGNGKILLMDDEELIRDIGTHILTELGYKVETAVNGEEALQKYQAALEAGEKYDVVIMDLTIPGGMGGKDAIQKLRELDPQVIAIVSSGYSSDPVMAEYENYGFKGCIRKPFTVKEFSQVLFQVLGEKKTTLSS